MASGGDSIGPEGVKTTATIACFARTNLSNAPVAVTAMHLVTDVPLPASTSLRFVSPSIEMGSPAFLGTLYRGTTVGVDAAAILLGANVLPTDHVHGIGLIQGCRPMTGTDRYKPVRMYGAGSQGVVVGRIESLPLAMPELGLDDAFFVSLGSVPGDSGAAIVANDQYVLGLLKGRYPGSDGLAVAVTITSALEMLRCNMSRSPLHK
jgi:hypothetical protein